VAERVGQCIFGGFRALKTVSRGGYSKYIIYHDQFSGWVAIYPLDKKSDATSTLNELSVELDLPNRGYQTTIRPDGDPSCFDTYAFKEACAKRNFIWDPTPPYTPEHNAAERAIEAIDFKARVSLLDAPHLDFDFYYLDASVAAVHSSTQVSYIDYTICMTNLTHPNSSYTKLFKFYLSIL